MNKKNTVSVCIAGLNFRLDCSLPMLDEFICHSNGENDGCVFRAAAPLLKGGEKPLALLEQLEVYQNESGVWIFTSPACRQTVQVSLSADYGETGFYIPENIDETLCYPALRGLLRIAFESRGFLQSRISLHSACIDVNGEAVAFTGVSGMGKSTRASAWVDAVAAEFISGDRPTLQVDACGAVAYGVPWDGKEQIFRNVSRNLKAILDVRRSDSVYLRKLDCEQARRVLIKQIFVPMWDSQAAATTVILAGRLAKNVPVYRLYCGPDAESAKEAFDILFNRPDEILEAEDEMKIKEGFALRKIAGEFIVMPTGSNIASFDGAIALNEVAAFIFEKLQNPASKNDLLIAVLNEYDVEKEVAERDIDAITAQFAEMGIIE